MKFKIFNQEKITDKVDINQKFRDLLHSLYISFLLLKYIYDQFIKI